MNVKPLLHAGVFYVCQGSLPFPAASIASAHGQDETHGEEVEVKPGLYLLSSPVLSNTGGIKLIPKAMRGF
jgi:hypothetical protein